jgi:hypothetical protein
VVLVGMTLIQRRDKVSVAPSVISEAGTGGLTPHIDVPDDPKEAR